MPNQLHGKKYRTAEKNRDVAATYAPKQALDIVKKSAFAKFDETMEVTRAVRETKAGKIEFRVDKAGNVQASIGKVSFPLESLETNFNAFMDQIVRSKPASSKGVYVRNVSVSSTMGPGVKIDTNPYR